MTNPELLRRNGEKGQGVIHDRAQLRRELKEGKTRLSDVLYPPTLPEYLHTWVLESLLLCVPYLPHKTISAWLEEIPIKPTATVSDPTYRKRRALVAKLKAWEGRSQDDRRARPKVGHGTGRQRASSERAGRVA